jgi:uncharacterized protein (UPF0548 family)
MKSLAMGPLASRRISYDAVGETCPAKEAWGPARPGFRGYARTVRIGQGDDFWRTAQAELLGWGIKRRSGFTVTPPPQDAGVQEGDRYWLIAQLGRLRVREPAVVVAVTRQPDRCGFAYGTLRGHPVSGEEAFIVHRTADGTMWPTLRSLTRAPQGLWRITYPLALAAQRVYRHRYLRAFATKNRHSD